MRKGKACGACVVASGTIAGLVMTVYSGVLSLQVPDASRDFATLSSKCAVVAVYHDLEERSKHNHATKGTDVRCYDAFTYQFAWCQDASTCSPSDTPASVGNTTGRYSTPAWSSTAKEIEVYREWWTSFPPPAAFANAGWESELLLTEPELTGGRSGACSGTAGDPSTTSSHKAGDMVTCYKPTSEPVNAAYTCNNDRFTGSDGNNDRCVKLSDPAGDLESLQVATSEALYVGIGITGFFGLFWLCGLWSNGFSCKQYAGISPDDD